jgi:hypothetical protein
MNAAEIAALPFFKAACSKLGVEPSKRQARKAKQGTGKWKGHQLVACLNNINAPQKEAA